MEVTRLLYKGQLSFFLNYPNLNSNLGNRKRKERLFDFDSASMGNANPSSNGAASHAGNGGVVSGGAVELDAEDHAADGRSSAGGGTAGSDGRGNNGGSPNDSPTNKKPRILFTEEQKNTLRVSLDF